MSNGVHKNNSTFKPPPQRLPAVVERAKDTYKKWIFVYRNIPRAERLGIGSKIDSLFLELLESLRRAAYSPIPQKIILLEKVSIVIDSLRFFIQLLWELHDIPNEQFISLGADIESIGQMVGGWKRGLIAKTQPFPGKNWERKE